MLIIEKRLQKLGYLDKKKSILGEIKSILLNLLKDFFDKIQLQTLKQAFEALDEGFGFFLTYVDFIRGITHSMLYLTFCLISKID